VNDTLVICGDSFNYGIGCTNLYTQPYGILTAKNIGMECIRLARGSASNYTIQLQGIYASKMKPVPKLVILGTTSYDRVEWVAEGKKLSEPPSLENLNYHQYPPHLLPQPLHDAPMPWHLEKDSAYEPKILSEQVVVFQEYFKQLKTNNSSYYKRLQTEPKSKLEIIDRYYFEIYNEWIKRDYDVGVIMLAYRQLKKAGINCIIAGPDYKYLDFVDDVQDFFPIDWGSLSKEYPDTINSLHTSEVAHALIANKLTRHIKINGFI